MHQIFVTGSTINEQPVAVIVPNITAIERWSRNHPGRGNLDLKFQKACVVSPSIVLSAQENMVEGEGSNLGEDATFVAALRSQFEEIASEHELFRHELPGKIFVERNPWTVENGMLNSQFKLARSKFKTKYSSMIDQL